MEYRADEFDRDGVVAGIVGPVQIPRMAGVRQIFDGTKIADVAAAVRCEIEKPEIRNVIRPGMKVAVTVGSRGISNLPLIVRNLVEALRSAGASPYIVPAMGSHGGATAHGQTQVLAGMGITAETAGAPVRATMDTVIIGRNGDGKPVHLDKAASEADGIVVLGRIKPHTCFHGTYESGLVKMMAIGLGNQHGAQTAHAEGFGNMARAIVLNAETVLSSAPILFGLALVENAYLDTCVIEAVPPGEILSREPILLSSARERMPRIMLDPLDVMIVDRIGKNYSGDGMDPNVTGSYATPYATGGPQTQIYVVLDLSDQSHGNANGAGMAQFSTRRLFEKIDPAETYPNSITAKLPIMARTPIIMPNDLFAVKAAIHCCVDVGPAGPRIVRIPNSSHVNEIMVSEALFETVKGDPRFEVLRDPEPLVFDGGGNLF